MVLETTLSGITDLSFGRFLLLMQPIHLAIGVVEGLVTAAVLGFLWRSRPELQRNAAGGGPAARGVLVSLLVAAILTGGVLSWFASSDPDGLEWSVFRATGTKGVQVPDNAAHQALADLQKRTALLPEYAFPARPEDGGLSSGRAGTSVSGLVGGALSLALSLLIGLVLRKKAGAGADRTG